jgi:endonuclease/exonuclease/phosphatase family metal-dependent hydrolase
MKMILFIFVIFVFSLLTLLVWCGYPWSLKERKLKGEIIRVEPEGMVNNEEFPSVIKFQTWNLGYLFGEGSEGTTYIPQSKSFYEEKLNQLAIEIRDSSPDVICLQEIDFESNRTSFIDQAQYLAIKANYPYVAEVVSWEANYVPFPYWPLDRNFGRMKSGGAILSKYPIISHEIDLLKKPLSQPWWYNAFYPHRYFQKVEIEIGEKKFRIINVHLEAFDKVDRKEQVELLANKVQTEKIDIVAGDFNMLPTSASKKSKFRNPREDYENDSSYEAMLTSGLSEVIPESIYSLDEPRYLTFPSSLPDRRLDYIFYENGLKMIKAEILPSALSDHLPLKATFQIANPKFNPYSQ